MIGLTSYDEMFQVRALCKFYVEYYVKFGVNKAANNIMSKIFQNKSVLIG